MVVSIYFLDPSYFGPQSEANPGDCQSFLPSVRNCESSKDCRIGRFHLSESKLREVETPPRSSIIQTKSRRLKFGRRYCSWFCDWENCDASNPRSATVCRSSLPV